MIFVNFALLLVPFFATMSAQPLEGIRSRYPSVHVCLAAAQAPSLLLPYTLGQLEALDYPKYQISIQVSTGDNNAEWFQQYAKRARRYYKSVENSGSVDVSYELCAREAQAADAAYAFVLESSSLLIEPKTLQSLVAADKPAIAPMLRDLFSNQSNYKTNINGFFDDDYLAILNLDRVGITTVQQISHAVLLDVKHVFSTSDDHFHAPSNVFVSNRHEYGWMLSGEQETREHALHNLLMALLRNSLPPLLHTPLAPRSLPKPSLHGFGQIYVINLDRRPDRYAKMRYALEFIGLQHTRLSAVDGQKLSEASLLRLGVRQLPGYEDPYYKRPMKMGEIGCFLSHYNVWREVVSKNYKRVIVLEDDVLFSAEFIELLHETIEDVDAVPFDWDLIYLGRKRMADNDEFFVKDIRHISNVTYSYWTVGYLLSNSGAQKLINARPLSKMIALDEYLPIMYGKHPNTEWSKHFSTSGTLKAYGFWPFLIQPTHYTYELDYVTDTESSAIIDLARLQEIESPTHTVLHDVHTATELLRDEL